MHSYNVFIIQANYPNLWNTGLQGKNLLASLPFPFALKRYKQPSYCIASPEYLINNQVTGTV